jgi:Pentapeptide repeats (8 copies)
VLRPVGPTVTATPASGAPNGGDDHGPDKAVKPKRSIVDYAVLIGLVGLFISVVTLFDNQVRTRQELETTRQELNLTQLGQFNERYAHAIEQLGSERLPSRLTGIYELEQVALASPEHYQLGMEILADYLRIVSPASVAPGPGTPEPPNAAPPAEVGAIMKVLGRRPKDREPVRLDLSGVNLWALDLGGADLSMDDLSGGDFEGANLSEARLMQANFSEATLTGANLFAADLTGADLFTANLAGATLYQANLAGAILLGTNLAGADLREVQNLTQTQLDAAMIDEDTQLPSALGTPEPLPSPLSTPPGSGTPWSPPVPAPRFGLRVVSNTMRRPWFNLRIGRGPR